MLQELPVFRTLVLTNTGQLYKIAYAVLIFLFIYSENIILLKQLTGCTKLKYDTLIGPMG